MTYVFLVLAILAEVIATSALKASESFSRLGPSLVVVLGYGVSFYLLTLVLRDLPLGVTYAVWSGLGIVLVTLFGVVVYREVPDLPAILGLAMIVGGVAILHLFSSASPH
ncbi:DMT family transporter [Cobetia sp. L2A1]|jgi:small multidrug resistance pump|uniref:DMT family transporter n=1 Tax=Cobetia sp. L2A1 TaxID=2686360 RepID=UPI00131B504E|nr:multidrug efflux SMR transporter [Cobetia sp. L2A1]